mmetsp:Transcript_9171/g.13827  ORF Transcript_9171/g.13827 Transcript_9171/m.13827 type:complete len:93 (-) Transcript_9171:1247-1525(-)
MMQFPELEKKQKKQIPAKEWMMPAKAPGFISGDPKILLHLSLIRQRHRALADLSPLLPLGHCHARRFVQLEYATTNTLSKLMCFHPTLAIRG